jgi:hypothetical protein
MKSRTRSLPTPRLPLTGVEASPSVDVSPRRLAAAGYMHPVTSSAECGVALRRASLRHNDVAPGTQLPGGSSDEDEHAESPPVSVAVTAQKEEAWRLALYRRSSAVRRWRRPLEADTMHGHHARQRSFERGCRRRRAAEPAVPDARHSSAFTALRCLPRPRDHRPASEPDVERPWTPRAGTWSPSMLRLAYGPKHSARSPVNPPMSTPAPRAASAAGEVRPCGGGSWCAWCWFLAMALTVRGLGIQSIPIHLC